jgi:hypothetical protein
MITVEAKAGATAADAGTLTMRGDTADDVELVSEGGLWKVEIPINNEESLRLLGALALVCVTIVDRLCRSEAV